MLDVPQHRDRTSKSVSSTLSHTSRHYNSQPACSKVWTGVISTLLTHPLGDKTVWPRASLYSFPWIRSWTWMEVSQLWPHNEENILGGGTDRRGREPRLLNDPTAQRAASLILDCSLLDHYLKKKLYFLKPPCFRTFLLQQLSLYSYLRSGKRELESNFMSRRN